MQRTYTLAQLIELKMHSKMKTLPTKAEFGRLMHGDMDEDTKKQIAEKVMMAGGYDGLEEGDDD